MKKLLDNFDLKGLSSTNRLIEKYNINIVNDSVLEKKHSRIGKDIRFHIPEFKANSLSILIESIEKRTPVFAFTFFEINSGNMDACQFWHYDESSRKLNKINLRNLIGSNTESIITPGYVICEEEDFQELGNFYNEVAENLYGLFGNRAFIEIRGEKRLKKKILEMQEIPLDGKRIIKEEFMGSVNDNTPTSLEYAKVHGFIELDNVYNYYTLGKVMFKEELLSLYRKYANI